VNTNERWRVLDDLFTRASEMDASQRSAFVQGACGTDSELRHEVEALLTSLDKTVGWLRRPVDGAARELAFAGRRVGPYVMLRLLGQGGMGRVFLAARADEQYQQLVAIKLMYSEFWQADAMLERFRAERQILASLNHPNIARLLDGGMTSDGAPYLVMEYIEGAPLDEYCRMNQLSVEAKLGLFLRICAAVEYAHKNLVVHRDIKPGNVLVAGDGTPKLVDFGIAKLLDAGERVETRATAPMMTPEYASPEQLRGDPITTATDVYSLGALLYELLAGAPPFAGCAGNPVEMMQRICEADPQPPSSIASRRPSRSTRATDLDRIVLMAMRKQPERRYPSVTALASDVSAYLERRPILARGGGWRYRAGKFVRRHKLVATSLTLLVLSLISFTIAMTVQLRHTDRERLKAARAAEFLAEMFQASTPQEARGRAITARELLDRGSQRVEKELAAEPEVRASLLYSIGDAYARLGLYRQARDLAGKSYTIRVKALGPRDPATADSLHLLAKATRLTGEYAQAEPLFRKALAIRRVNSGADGIAVAEGLSSLGECLYLEGKNEEAESKLRQALAIFERHSPNLGSRERDYLARVLETKGDYVEAASLLRDASDIDKRTGGPDSPSYTMSLHNLAGALSRLGDLYTAEALLEESLATERQVLGDNHPDLGYPLNLLGVVALEEGDWRKAEPFLRETLGIWDAPGSNHTNVVVSMTNWARLLAMKGRCTEARRYFERALDLTKGQADSSYFTAWVSARYALAEVDAGDYPKAEDLARRVITIQQSNHGGETAATTAQMMITLGEARVFQGDPAGAEPSLRQALQTLKTKLPPRYPPVATAEVRLGEALTAQGKAATAEPMLREALESVSAPPFRIPDWQVGEAESALGWCLGSLGRMAEARRLLAQSQKKLANDPRPVFRKQATVHLEQLAALASKD
jgi:serine/threonine-protein kinase